MATHASVIAWRIPGTGEPSGCRLWGHTESDTTEATKQQQPDICPGVGLLDHTAILFLVCFFFFCLRNVFIVFHHVCGQSLSHFRLFATPRTEACQALLSIEFSRQEYWSGLPFPSPVFHNGCTNLVPLTVQYSVIVLVA